MKKTTLLALMAVAVLAVVVWGVGHLLSPWPKLLPEVSLDPWRPILRADQVTPDNACYYIRQLANYSSLPRMAQATDEYLRFGAIGWSAKAYPQLEEIVASNSERIALCLKAADVTNCQMVSSTSYTCGLPHVEVILNTSRAMCFAAEEQSGIGEWNQAEALYRSLLIINDDLTRGGTIIEFLVDYAGTALACRSIRRSVSSFNAPPSFVKAMNDTLLNVDANLEPLAESLRYERLGAVREFEAFCHGGAEDYLKLVDDSDPTMRFIVLLARLRGLFRDTQRDLDAVYSHIIKIASEPYDGGKSFDSLARIYEEPTWIEKVGFHFNDPIGRYLVIIVLPAMNSLVARDLVHKANLRGTALYVAVQAYRQDHDNRPPPDLEVLAPHYISSIPNDPFNGRSFSYRTTNTSWVVYSVGPNLIDDSDKYDLANYPIMSDITNQLDICFTPAQLDRAREEYFRSHPEAEPKP